MAEELQEAIQIIRITYEGIEIALKMGRGSIETMKKAVEFLIGMLEYEKTLGKASMKNLLKKGGDLQVFQFQESDMKKVKRFAKKYGILYSVLPDLNKKDGLSEIIFHTEAVPRINLLAQKLKTGRIATFDEYLKNGDEKELNKLPFLKGQAQGKAASTDEEVKSSMAILGMIEKVGIYVTAKQSISIDEIQEEFKIDHTQAETILDQLKAIGVVEKEGAQGAHKVLMDKDAFQNRILKYQELSQRMQALMATKNGDFVEITITKKLVVEENDHAVKTRIPYQKDRYIWISKEQAQVIHDGKTLLTFLDKNKEYKIYSPDNQVVTTMKGEKLYEKSYDPVAAEIRKRYAKAGQNSAKGNKTPSDFQTPSQKRR